LIKSNKDIIVEEVVKRDNLKEQHQYKDLYVYDGTTFVRLKETSSIKHIRTLVTSIQDAERTAAVVNKMNNSLLDEAETLIEGVLDKDEVSSLQGIIKAIIDNQKHLGTFVKDSPLWIESLKTLEDRILKDIKEEVELVGQRSKAFREDPDGLFDKGKASEVTEKRFE